MREYRFRGKRKDNGEWVEGFLFVSQMSGCFILLSKIDIKKHRDGGRTMGDKLEQYEVDPATVGQYTGLKDMNDVEVYEGDICHYKCGKSERTGEIKFIHGYFGLTRENGLVGALANILSPEIEVIGNIYENPELLKALGV